MSAEPLLSYLIWALFLVLGLITLGNAIRYPLASNIHVAVFFAIPALIILIRIAAALGLLRPGLLTNAINTSLLLALPFVLLRLVDDFVGVPGWLVWTAGLLIGGLAMTAFVFPPPRPPWFVPLAVLSFTGLQLYSAVAFTHATASTVGVTRRRLRTIALGSLLLGLAVLATALTPFAAWWRSVSEVAALGAGLSYFAGFAPPAPLRRTWQDPELRAFLRESASLPQVPEEHRALEQLERSAAAVFGSSLASIALWEQGARHLRFYRDGASYNLPPDPGTVIGHAFVYRRPILGSPEAKTIAAVLPERAAEVRAILAAPLAANGQTLGVIAIFTHRAALFANDDLRLADLIASQTAAVLENHRLLAAQARARGREEASRLKDDFLSAAAHDLMTPLTTLVVQTQHLERQLRRDPTATVGLTTIERMSGEAQRLRELIRELIDAANAERAQLVGRREPVDLAALVREIGARYHSDRHSCRVEAPESLVGNFDQQRIGQLVRCLLENAVRYSPDGGPIHLKLSQDGDTAHLAVIDSGIGISEEELPQVFERFFRGSNVNDRYFAGMGLSLFICRAIAEQHGGRMWVESKLGSGSTFHLLLPLTQVSTTHDSERPDPGG
ncbi:MAG: hypothetical protein OHK0015_27710 [Chloroflexi bacterium OHK40]